ncbi:MAG: LytR family transcriptional regulator [Micromonosporaceae bacterium]|nr:LytR family transcriptional regulator [Micromonosporaceae bacterium]
MVAPDARNPRAGDPATPTPAERAPRQGPEPQEGTPPGNSPSPGRPSPSGPAGPLNYLVIGSDRRVSNPGAGARADAIVIVHLPAGLREAYLISIPRDLRVPIPGHWPDKINAAYQYGGAGSGGAQLLSATLSDLTGIGFDGGAILDFGGFREIVDALDGIELCLDREVHSIHTEAVFPAGCQHLSGAQALDLARQRYGLPAGDLDRGRNHQRLIQAMVDRAAGSGLFTDPLRLDRTIRAVGDALTVDTGGVPLPELAYALRHLRPDRITGITLPAYPQMIDGTSYVLADPTADGLYRALRDSQVAEWADGHPGWRND